HALQPLPLYRRRRASDQFGNPAPRSWSYASRLVVHQLDKGLDVAEGESERLRPPRIPLDVRHVVGHDHAVVADLLVDAQGAEHVHVPVVGESLLEVEEAAFYVPEVDVEDLAPAAEVADDVVNLPAGFFQHLAHRALAEVEPVVRARHGLHEALEAV